MKTFLSKWQVAPDMDTSFVHRLNKQVKAIGEKPFHPIVAKHLQRIGFTTIRESMKFLFPKKEHSHSPWKLKGMRETVEALEDAIVSGKHITVVGDYDVDGIMATVIAYQTLTDLGAKVDTYIPHRKKEGYGIKPSIVDILKKRGTDVILTVDNGVSAHDAVALAKKYGMTVLVTDHHTPGDVLPKADCLINPHQKGDRYPFKEISGGAVAFKLAQALYEYMGNGKEEADKFVEHLAICTVADVMPLVDENRYFVLAGLEKIRTNPSRPIRFLFKAMGINHKEIDARTIGFYIGPALNAPGRLNSAEDALNLFLAKTPLEAALMANVCVEMNNRRKDLVEQALEKAEPLVTKDPVQVIRLDVEEGIAGIIAGQIKETTGSPTFVLTPARTDAGESILKGSARSHPGFSLYKALKQIDEKHPDWFKGWGGHSAAAGVSLDPDQLEAFRQAINQVYQQTEIAEPVFYFLDEVKEGDLEQLSFEFSRLAPFGHGHQEPVFKVRARILDKERFGPKQNHLRLFSEGGIEYMLFRGSDLHVETNQEANLYVSIGRSSFAGREKLDVFIQEIEQ